MNCPDRPRRAGAPLNQGHIPWVEAERQGPFQRQRVDLEHDDASALPIEPKIVGTFRKVTAIRRPSGARDNDSGNWFAAACQTARIFPSTPMDRDPVSR